MDFQQAKQVSPSDLNQLNQRVASVNVFGWRYIPNIGRPGAALSHATLFPQEPVYTAAWHGKGRIHWEAPDQDQYQYYQIIQALSQLPIKAYRECQMTREASSLRGDLARQLG
jgi:acetoacetate decarboxylase